MNPKPPHDPVRSAGEINIPFVGAVAMRLHLRTHKSDTRFADADLTTVMDWERSGLSERPHSSDPATVIEFLEQSTINCMVPESRDEVRVRLADLHRGNTTKVSSLECHRSTDLGVHAYSCAESAEKRQEQHGHREL